MAKAGPGTPRTPAPRQVTRTVHDPALMDDARWQTLTEHEQHVLRHTVRIATMTSLGEVMLEALANQLDLDWAAISVAATLRTERPTDSPGPGLGDLLVVLQDIACAAGQLCEAVGVSDYVGAIEFDG